MKIKQFILLITLSLSCFVFGKETMAYQIFTSNGKPVDFEKIIKDTENKQFVFFGEYHNNPICHWLEFELTKEMHQLYKNNLMLGAEMFEADNQYIITEYLKGQISATNFQDEVRLWTNYNTDYKPLLEYAKAQNLNFIATNVPRRYANMVFKKGITSLNDLSELAKSFIAPLDRFNFDSTVTCYKELMASMEGHGGVNMATAQALKDATMAHFISKNSTNKSVFLHFNGAYHSNNYQGIITYLEKTALREKMLTISTVEQENIDKLDTENEGLADYIICTPESMTKTH